MKKNIENLNELEIQSNSSSNQQLEIADLRNSPKSQELSIPRWVDKKNLMIYYNISEGGKVPKFEYQTTKKLLAISEYFSNEYVINSIVKECLIPIIDKSTCLKILIDFIDKFNYEKSQYQIYYSLVHLCIEISSKNIYYLINNQQDELSKLNEDTLEEIVEKYFEMSFLKSNIDHSLIMRLLISSRKLLDIFELLENERKRSLVAFEKILQESIEPTINWKIKNQVPSTGYYKESGEFSVDSINIVIINFYDAPKDTLNIALRISSINGTNTLNTKETDTCLSQGNSTDNSNVSILSQVEIPDLKYKSKTNFNCVFNNNRAKVLICKIEGFKKLFEINNIGEDSMEHTLKIYFNISYNFSAILTHICKNFYEYYSLNSISKVSKNVLNIILKNKNLNIRSEDEVLFSIITYINNKRYSNPEGIKELFSNINWNNISLDGLLDFILQESKLLLETPIIQEILIDEFNRRFKEQIGIKDENKDKHTLKNNLSSKNLLNSNIRDGRFNLTNSNNNQNFTSDLIMKLVKIASKYDNQGYTKNEDSNNFIGSFSPNIISQKLSNNNSFNRINSSRNNVPYVAESKANLKLKKNTSGESSEISGKLKLSTKDKNETGSIQRPVLLKKNSSAINLIQDNKISMIDSRSISNNNTSNINNYNTSKLNEKNNIISPRNYLSNKNQKSNVNELPSPQNKNMNLKNNFIYDRPESTRKNASVDLKKSMSKERFEKSSNANLKYSHNHKVQESAVLRKDEGKITRNASSVVKKNEKNNSLMKSNNNELGKSKGQNGLKFLKSNVIKNPRTKSTNNSNQYLN